MFVPAIWNDMIRVGQRRGQTCRANTMTSFWDLPIIAEKLKHSLGPSRTSKVCPTHEIITFRVVANLFFHQAGRVS